MAYQYVRTIAANSGNYYVIRFDPDTLQFECIKNGPYPAETTLTEGEVGAAEGQYITYFCSGTTKYEFLASLTTPFTTLGTVTPNSTDCGYTPPTPPPTPPEPPPPSPNTIAGPNVYQIAYTNFEEQDVTIDIYDRLNYTPGTDLTIASLQAGDAPLKITIIDNDESKFTPIRARQAVITFLSTNSFKLATFLSGADDRWYVHITIGGETEFQGFLVLDDMGQEFLDDDTWCEVALTATDNLGSLQDIALVDFADKNPKGYYRIADLIAMCLRKTGLSLDIMVANNLMEESTPGLPFYHTCYLHALTFEKEIGISDDCHTVLSKILGQDSYITQWKGQWWIRRIDEYDTQPVYAHRFYFDGSFGNSAGPVTYGQTIGFNQPIFFSQDNTHVKGVRPNKYADLDYKYELPQELIPNIDFSRGDWLSPIILPNETVDGKLLNARAYNLEDWAVKAGSFTANVPPQSTAYIERKFDSGVEVERFAVITTTHDGVLQWLQSGAMPVGKKDKITFSVDVRFGTITTILGPTLSIQLFLVGEDGITYILKGNPKGYILNNASIAQWAVYDGTDTGFNFAWDESVNGDWLSFNTTDIVPPLPVSGDLYFTLPYNRDEDVNYQNINITYTPYINGSYLKYTGQSSKVTQDGNYKAKIAETVSVSDSPKKLFKGALFKQLNGKYVLAGRFYNGAVFPGGVPDSSYLHPYGYIQVFSVWNQRRRVERTFEATMQGLRTADVDSIPDLMHTYLLTDSSPHTNGKQFILLHFDKDYKSCEWTGVFAEAYDTTEGKKYDDPFDFRYLTDKTTVI